MSDSGRGWNLLNGATAFFFLWVMLRVVLWAEGPVMYLLVGIGFIAMVVYRASRFGGAQ